MLPSLLLFALIKSLPEASASSLGSIDGLFSPDNGFGSDCPLAGPGFPSPSHLSESVSFSEAVSLFEGYVSDEKLGLEANDTAWAVAIFSAKENKTLYERYHTPPIDVGVSKVDRDSIFRLASVTKVLTVWTFLAELGDASFNEPISKYIPELTRANTPTDVIYDDIDEVRWEDITIGDLASQSAGIARDVSLDDLSVNYPIDELRAMGFPGLNRSAVPDCGGNITQPACSREEFFHLLLQKTPTWPSSHSPAYSNIAFHLLAYVLEAITGKDLETAMSESVFKPLGLQHSSYTQVPASGGVIPSGDPLAAGWMRDYGVDSAGGSVYMSTGDLVRAGQAILQSTLLPPAQTRRWLKPRMQTGYSGAAVGAPWEITFLELPNKRRVDFYIKDGDMDAYHSALVLSPQHDLGFVVLTAGTPASNATLIRTVLKMALGEIFMPAVETQAQKEAGVRFNGTYVDERTNSSVTVIAAYDGHPGLTVQTLISYGVPMIGPGSSPDAPLAAQLGIGNNTRLYPTTLKTVSHRSSGCGSYESRLGFRAGFQTQFVSGTLQDPCILNWANLDGVTYGKEAFDDWVFDLSEEDGKASGVNVRLLRLNLKRKI